MPCFRWRTHPSSLPSTEKVTPREKTLPRENLMARFVLWSRGPVTTFMRRLYQFWRVKWSSKSHITNVEKCLWLNWTDLMLALQSRGCVCSYPHRHGAGGAHHPQWTQCSAQDVRLCTHTFACTYCTHSHTNINTITNLWIIFHLPCWSLISVCLCLIIALHTCCPPCFFHFPPVSRGGVYTPGAAFGKTALIDRLHKHGIQFSVK